MAQDANTTTTVKRPLPSRHERNVPECITIGCTRGVQAHGLMCDDHALHAHFVADSDRRRNGHDHDN